MRMSNSYLSMLAIATVLVVIVLLTPALKKKQPIANLPVPAEEESTRLQSALETLGAADGAASFDVICDCLTILTEEGKHHAEAGAVLIQILPENSPLYRDRPRAQVHLIRGGVLATLARVGPPLQSMQWVLAELATTDDPFVFGAACQVAASLGPRAAGSVSNIQRAFSTNLMDHTFSLRDLRQRSPLQEPTTAKLEAVKALQAIGPDAAGAMPILREIAEGTIAFVDKSDELREAAREAIQTLSNHDPSPKCCVREDSQGYTTFTPWKVTSARPDPDIGGIQLRDQEGREFCISDFSGNPVFLSFFYTRCDNLRKCSRTVSTAAALRDLTIQAGLSMRSHILLISLDPLFDDPLRLQEYALARGFCPDRESRVAQSTSGDLEILCRNLQLPINFEGGRVNVHGIAAVLLDKEGRLARTYHSVSWDNDQVLTDLIRLTSE